MFFPVHESASLSVHLIKSFPELNRILDSDRRPLEGVQQLLDQCGNRPFSLVHFVFPIQIM